MSSLISSVRTFSFVFKDSLQRVYESFINFALFKETIFNSIPYKITKYKGESIDEIGAEFIIEISKVLYLQMIVTNVIKTNYHYSFTYKSLKMTNIKAQFSCVINFYYNTCENETLVITERHFEDSFSQLILGTLGINYIEKRMEYQINIVNENLYQNIKGQQDYQNIVINRPLSESWVIVSDLKFLFKEMTIKDTELLASNDNYIDIKSNINVIDNNNNQLNPVMIKRLYKNERKRKLMIVYNPHNMKQYISFVLYRLDNCTCLLYFNHSHLYVSQPEYEASITNKRSLLYKIKLRIEG